MTFPLPAASPRKALDFRGRAADFRPLFRRSQDRGRPQEANLEYAPRPAACRQLEDDGPQRHQLPQVPRADPPAHGVQELRHLQEAHGGGRRGVAQVTLGRRGLLATRPAALARRSLWPSRNPAQPEPERVAWASQAPGQASSSGQAVPEAWAPRDAPLAPPWEGPLEVAQRGTAQGKPRRAHALSGHRHR